MVSCQMMGKSVSGDLWTVIDGMRGVSRDRSDLVEYAKIAVSVGEQIVFMEEI